MKRTLAFSILLLIITAFTASAQSGYKQGLNHAYIYFPSRPSEKADSSFAAYTLPTDSATYGVTVYKNVYTDHKYIDTLYRDLQVTALEQASNYKLIYSKPLRIHDFRATSFKYIDMNDPSKPVYVYMEGICVDGNMYTIRFTTPYDNAQSVIAARERFVSSFFVR